MILSTTWMNLSCRALTEHTAQHAEKVSAALFRDAFGNRQFESSMEQRCVAATYRTREPQKSPFSSLFRNDMT
jgi:hypothetical protein